MQTSSELRWPFNNRVVRNVVFVGGAILFVGFMAWMWPLTRKAEHRRGLVERLEEIHHKVATRHKYPQLMDQLTDIIDDCTKWANETPEDREMLRNLASLHADRGMQYDLRHMYDKAILDIEKQSSYHKRAGDLQFYVSSSSYRVHLLRRAERWQEAFDLCHHLIDELGPEGATYRIYGSLVYLTKNAPNPDPKDVDALDEYRRMAILLAHGDWKEEQEDRY